MAVLIGSAVSCWDASLAQTSPTFFLDQGPILYQCSHRFGRQDVRRAHQIENYIAVQRFYMRTYDSFAQINALFKPSIVHKTVLKSIINALLEEGRLLYHKDEVRAHFVLIQNPVFAIQSSYTIFAHLLKQIVALHSADHQLLVHWFQL
ncbi:unnamed protein product [Nesidiocoris tenuis]|uniref:Uncharacterized protein n=1 Tax=Nesidiocoris tenuis TaxID=355587 RepID=A0A6H5FVG2_9HEMI|nr:unnamed protein product [Nesidiocoris tenuis]